MKFIADAMLGRLAKWLRLVGFDTLYNRDISDARLLRTARQENRLILTRDTHFLRFKDFNDTVFIHSNNTFEQLIELIRALNIKEFNASRCVKCNGVLINIMGKKEIEGLVPDYIYLQFNKFSKCQDCTTIYWEGSHIKRFREKVCEALEKVG